MSTNKRKVFGPPLTPEQARARELRRRQEEYSRLYRKWSNDCIKAGMTYEEMNIELACREGLARLKMLASDRIIRNQGATWFEDLSEVKESEVERVREHHGQKTARYFVRWLGDLMMMDKVTVRAYAIIEWRIREAANKAAKAPPRKIEDWELAALMAG